MHTARSPFYTIGLFLFIVIGIAVFFWSGIDRRLNSARDFEALSKNYEADLFIQESLLYGKEILYPHKTASSSFYIKNTNDSKYPYTLLTAHEGLIHRLDVFPYFGLSKNYYVDSFGSQVVSYDGKQLAGKEHFIFPTGITEHNGKVYISDAGKGSIFEYSSDGIKEIVTGLSYPTDLVFLGNDLLIVDTDLNSILRFKPDNTLSHFIGEKARDTRFRTALHSPLSIEIENNNLFISEHASKQIIAINLNNGEKNIIHDGLVREQKQCSGTFHPSHSCISSYDIDIFEKKLIISDSEKNSLYAQKSTMDKITKLQIINPYGQDEKIENVSIDIPTYEDENYNVKLFQSIKSISGYTIYLNENIPQNIAIDSIEIFGRNIPVTDAKENALTLNTFYIPRYYIGKEMYLNIIKDNSITFSPPEDLPAGYHSVLTTFETEDTLHYTTTNFMKGDEILGNNNDTIYTLQNDLRSINTVKKDQLGLRYTFWSPQDETYIIKNLDDQNFDINLTPPQAFTSITKHSRVFEDTKNSYEMSFSKENNIIQYTIRNQNTDKQSLKNISLEES